METLEGTKLFQTLHQELVPPTEQPDARSGGLGPVEIRGNDWGFLRSKDRVPQTFGSGRKVRVVDLFAGAGGLTLGAVEAASSLGRRLDVRYSADFEEAAAACYAANFPSARSTRADLRDVFRADLNARMSAVERALAAEVGSVDILMGGPPCQGHSDLNNYSRRDDPKNHLYKVMGRAAKILRPKHVLIENVPGAAHDRSGSVATTIDELTRLGYYVDVGVVDAHQLGVPQKRKRLIVVASTSKKLSVESIVEKYQTKPRDIRWAIEDIQDEPGRDIASTTAVSAAATRKRIDYLFDHNVLDLPDSERPPCHSAASHSYKSVYGRLMWEQPAQTITSGFYSMCMGRYVHPSRRRTLTAHEAARIQFFPDYFDFRPARTRTALAKIIGNAVPPKMIYPFIRELLC